MASSPDSRFVLQPAFDPAQPFKGVVVCCTSVSPDVKTDIANQTAELGGIHKYDLTPDCTHLIVGEYDTPKYRHVAKERPDVKAMAAGWVTAVRNVWVQDAEMDFEALEKEWQLRTFETNGGEPDEDGTLRDRGRLLCCVTGFDDPTVRQEISDLVQASGGIYTGDLTKRVTHLIAYKPEGRKYQAAKNWGIQTVSIEWVRDSVERGMILDEKCYDPVLPKEERGVGAWNKQRGLRATSLGKRLRDNTAAQEDGKKKLRRSTSMKLNSQRDNLWGDILGKPPASEPPPVPAFDTPAPQPAAPVQLDTQGSKLSSFGRPDDGAIFASCRFYLHGFTEKQVRVLVNAVVSLGGLVAHSLDELASASGAQMAYSFMIVPQGSKAETHPVLPDNIHIVTEFYIERCMDKRYFLNPSEHVIGRPFPAFPIPGFEKLSVCTSGFAGLDLNQLNKSVQQLGAGYQERFTSDVSVLVCKSLSTARKEKVEFALKWKVPVVKVEWLWECISAGFNVPVKEFLFAELNQKVDRPKQPAAACKETEAAGKDATKSSKPKEAVDKDLLHKPVASNNSSKSKRRPRLDESAFAPEKHKPSQSFSRRAADETATAASNFTTTFETALTHQHVNTNNHTGPSSCSSSSKTPLSDTSPNELNKSSTDQNRTSFRKPLTRIRSEVADSEQEEDDDMTDVAHSLIPPPESPETISKRLEAEKQVRIAAERQAISNKLASSLLHLTSSSAGGGSAPPPPALPAPAAAAPAASSLPEPVVSETGAAAFQQDSITTTGINSGITTTTSTTTRKRREVFARAISNISTGSNSSAHNGSGSGSGSGSASGSGSKTTASAPTKTEQGLAADTTTNGMAHLPPPPPPASTQLDYEDEASKKHKKQLMNKMLGIEQSRQEGGEGGGGGERLTIAAMAREIRPGGRETGSGTTSTRERRTRRR